MASFEQHVNTAVIASSIVVVPLHSSGFLDVNQSLLALTLGLVGGVLPDLDSNTSKPIRIVFKMLSILLPMIMILKLSADTSVLKIFVIWLIASALLHFVVFKIFLEFTKHRGIFHSIPMGLLFGQIVIYISYFVLDADIQRASIYGFFIFFGFMIHLVLDEIFSINAFGMYIKKSFGSALKLYDKDNKIGSLAIYGLNIAMLFMIPFEAELFLELFKSLSSLKIV